MKLKIQIFFLATIILFVGACKKDLGNYDYNDVNALASVNGIDEVITATYGKQFLLDPKVVFTQVQDAERYSYKWTYIGPNGLGGTKQFMLADTKNLDLTMMISPGIYSFSYHITDNETNITFRYPFKLKVVNEINEGWILMCDVDGAPRVDMLSLNTENEFETVIDLLSTTASQLKLEGKPIMTYAYSTGLLIGPDKISYGLYFGTDKGTQKVDPNTFNWTPTMGLNYEMFGTIPNGFYADVIQQRTNSKAYLIGGRNLYYYNRTLNIGYSVPLNHIASEDGSFEVAPFIGANPLSTADHAIFFDLTNRRFVKHTGYSAACTPIPDNPKDQRLFDFKIGLDLTYMQWVPFNGGEVFSILKHPVSSKSYLARFNNTNLIQSYYEEILAPDFEKSEYYAISPNLAYIFYSVESKVYQYDMSSKKTKLMTDFGSDKISYMKFYPFKSIAKYPDSDKLMIATYTPTMPSGTNGKIGIYTVPPVNGDIILNSSFAGFGKVKDLTYRER